MVVKLFEWTKVIPRSSRNFLFSTSKHSLSSARASKHARIKYENILL